MKRKILIITVILITIINTIMPAVNAVTLITKANLVKNHQIDSHIMYYNEEKEEWRNIQCGYICYKMDGEMYPAYCITHGVNGVDEEGSYTVTINDLLKDKLIYNTIINGYPYKTTAQLGVETNDDAYVATKHAVNSVLLGRDVRAFYKATDERGEKIINAIYNISEQGKKGNVSNTDANITVKKVGKMVESGAYYFQEYTVEADKAISNYTINSLEGFSRSCYTTDTNAKRKTNFEGNQNFRVMIPKADLNKDISGKINITASCNTMPIFYGKAPSSNMQNYAVTYKPYIEYKKQIIVEELTNTARIQVIKRDEEDLKPISNVVFNLYKENGDLVETKETDANGVALFEKLYQGKYKVQEIKPNEDYIQIDTMFDVNAEYNKLIYKTISNTHKKGNLKIIKVDKDNNDITLGSIEFDLINENGKVIKHLITDVNGEAEAKNIDTGTYTLKETKTKREYNLCENKNIVVKWNETSEIIIENEKKKGQIKILKEDFDLENIKLKGVKFQILNKNNEIIEEIETDTNGEVISSKLPIGEYKIKEISLGENINYILNEKEYIINVEDNKISDIKIKNEHKTGELKIKKVDKDDDNILLEGVEFEITDKNGLKYKIKTDKNGIANIKNIRIGNIKIKEITTNKKYELLDKTLNTDIKFNECSEIIIENEKKKGQVEITKIDKEDNSIKLENVEFEILDNENRVVDVLKTNKNGYAISKKIPIGKYYLKEIKTNNKYILNSTEIEINIKEDNILKLNVENEKIKGKIKIVKSSSSDSPLFNIKKGDYLSGVIFDIFNEDGKLIDSVTTNEKGQAISKELEIGRYKVKERTASKYYILNTNDFFVDINNDNEIKVIEIKNDPIIPMVKIEKSGPKFATKNEEIKYEFDIQNISNSKLDSFTWKEYIPYKYCKLTKMITGVYNKELEYEIYYKTNLSDYKFLKKANSMISDYITFETIELLEDEIITEIKIEYGTVPADFSCEVKPVIFSKIDANVKKRRYYNQYNRNFWKCGRYDYF